MAESSEDQVPQTIEGWYVLHDVYAVDWAAWRVLPASERESVAGQAQSWLTETSSPDRGDSAYYSVLSQKGDLMFVHYRESPDALNEIEFSMRKLRLYDFLKPTYSYFSVIEVSLYEVMAIAMKRVAERGLERGSPAFQAALEEEMGRQKSHMDSRLYREIPTQKYICFYPMNKRRGEHVNWYALPLAERRAMMRSHGTIGHKYIDTVTQVIAGSVGLDDWEWGVSLHSNDALVFKKLIYEMRFDPASALYAEFGPFYVGIRRVPAELPCLLASDAHAD